MVDILYKPKPGKNFKIPGLPYDEKYKFVQPIILSDVPTQEEVFKLISSAPEGTLVNPWTVDVIKGFMNYIPSTYKKITKDMDPVLLKELFGVTRDHLPEEERLLLQLQSEIDAKSATLDAAIIHDRMDVYTVANKVHLANRIYLLGQLYGHLKRRETPMLFHGVATREDWYKTLTDIKLLFEEFMLEVPVGARKYPVEVKKPTLSESEINKFFPYLPWLQKKLGKNLKGVLLYGSAAANYQDPSKFNDFDNWVVVDDIVAAHLALRGTKPGVDLANRRVREGCSDKDKSYKLLGIHLQPNDLEYRLRHAEFLHDSREFKDTTLVLLGEFPFYAVDMDENIERGVSHAEIKLKTLAGSLNWAYLQPEKLLDAQSLFEFLVKLNRMFMQHSMNATEGYAFRDKHVVDGELKRRHNIIIPEFRQDPAYIQEALLYSFVSGLALQKELIAKRPGANLDFMMLDAHRKPRKTNRWFELEDLPEPLRAKETDGKCK